MGKRMRYKRKSIHLTQEQMAEYLGVSPKHYGGFERGKAGMSLENLVNAAEILGLSLDYLVKGDEIASVPADMSVQKDPSLPFRIQEILSRSSEKKRILIMELMETIDKY